MSPARTMFSALAASILLALEPSLVSADPGAEAEPATWPQWRGPHRDGRVPASTFGADLSEESLTVAWRIRALGPSYSGPVADAEHVYTTATVEEESEVVTAHDRRTGEVVWKASWEGAMEVPFFAARNGSWIRSTPAVDAESLYVAGMRDVLVCLDKRTGEVRWSVDFHERFGAARPAFGCVSSPLATDDHVYMQAGSSAVKLDKRTGETAWRTTTDSGDRMSGGAFSSPVLAVIQGRQQLVAQSREELAGLDIETGQILWATPVRAFRGMNILTPTVLGDAVFTTAYGGRSHLFGIAAEVGVGRVEPVWTGSAQGYMTSPVVVDGFAYLFLRSNRFTCIDLATGEQRWTSPPTGDSYWSLAVQGDRILALADTGVLRLLRADPDAYEVLSERTITEDETWAHVATAGDQILVRSLGELIALSWQ